MKSRMVGHSPDLDEAATSRSSWARRVVLGTLGTAGAGVALAAFAASAFANAANPLPDAHGSITPLAGGAVRVDVGGTWNWGAISGSSTQSDCNKRYAVGWAVDWWGLNGPGTSIAGLRGQVAVTTGGTPSVTEAPLATPEPTTTLTNKSHTATFHASTLLNGFDPNLCAHVDAQGFPEGPWSAYAIYPNEQSVPKILCVNMYDLHGSPGNPQLGDFTSTNSDNSISKNDFNPATNAGYCFSPTFSHPLSISVDKTNDANQDSSFNKTETANSANQAVDFKVVVTNNSQTAVAVIDGPITDAFSGSSINVCNTTNGTNIIGTELNPGASVTCTFTLSNYAPSAGSKDNTVTVNVHEKGLAANTASAQSTSTVNAPNKAHLAANILLCSDPNAALPNTGALVTSGGPTNVPNANNSLPSTAVDPGTYTVTATAPTGYHLTVCGAYNGANAQQATLAGGQSQTLNFYVAQNGAPALSVAKDGPATGLLNGNGTYTIRATNTGNADSTATTFTDTLPTGETFVAAGSSTDCSANGQLVTCNLGALAQGGHQDFTVVVTYTQTGNLQDCATIAGQPVPSCVTTHVGAPNVRVAKSGPATGVLGGNGTYTIVATNTGDAASTATAFTDTLPAGETFVSAGSSNACSANGQIVTCTLGALDAAGGAHSSASFTIVVSYSQTGQLTDCATIAGQPNPSCVTTDVGQPNVSVVKSGPATGVLGGNGTYTLVATNTGNATSTATTVYDVLPDGETFVAAGSSSACSATGQTVTCSLGALAPGAHADFTVVVSYSKIGSLTDCASVPGQATPSCVTTRIPGSPALTVVKTNDANNDGVFHDTETASAAGDAVTFKVSVANTSNVAVVIDSVTDAFGSTSLGECDSLLGLVLQPGDVVTCEFTLQGYAPAAGSSLTDTVTVLGHEDGIPGNTTQGADTSTVVTATPPTPGAPDLAIVKTASADKVKSGDTLTYTLAVTNVGAGATTGAITVTDTVPSGLDLVSVDGGSSWDCTASGRDITCTYLGGDLTPGEAAGLITVVTTVNDSAIGVVINTGVVSTPGDNNPNNDRSTVKTPVTKVLGEKIPKTTPPTQTLPFTGSNSGSLLPVGLAMVLFGALLIGAARRRRRTA